MSQEIKNPKSTLENLLNEIKADATIKENKGGKSKESIYKLKGLTTEESKKERTKIRRKFDKLSSNVIHNFKRENGIKEDTKKAISDFMQYYKEICILNDFSLRSIASDNRSEADKKMLQRCLDICKLHIAK